MKELTTEQRTYGWYYARFGMFTASQVSKLMGKTDIKDSEKKKDVVFGDTSLSYIRLLAGEEKIKEKWKDMTDEEKDSFLRVQYSSNAEMKWGTDHEDMARNAFSYEMDKNILQSGSCIKQEREYVSASPDGFIKEENALVEIKCPKIETYVKYSDTVVDAESLKEVKPDYYWQIMLQLYVTDAEMCYFVWYHPLVGMAYACIERNQADIDLLLSRIDRANEIKKSVYDKL